MKSCLSFKVWTHGFNKRDLRELPSSFLKRKESKVRGENSDFAWTGGNGEVSWMFVLRKVKEEVRWKLLESVISFYFKKISDSLSLREKRLKLEVRIQICVYS